MDTLLRIICRGQYSSRNSSHTRMLVKLNQGYNQNVDIERNHCLVSRRARISDLPGQCRLCNLHAEYVVVVIHRYSLTCRWLRRWREEGSPKYSG